MRYEEWIALNELYNQKIDAASDALQVFPRGEMGLVTDEVSSSDEYISAKRNYNFWFQKARSIRSGKEYRGFVKRKGKETIAKRYAGKIK
jgi:hypothetical protein